MNARPDTVRARPRRRFDRIGVAITVAATVVGVWFGYAGPSESPVVPPAPTTSLTVPVDTALVTPAPVPGP